MSELKEPRPNGVRTRNVEVVVALILLGLGLLVIYDSRRLGAGWGSDGPEAGYFPFYIGLLMSISSVVTLGQTLFGKTGRAQARAIFVERQALRQVLSVLIPGLVYVLGIQLIGLYVASAIYIAGFMLWLGSYGWTRSVLVGVGVSALAFVTFEVWFQVPLFKGAFNPLWFLGY
jgi:hypothetical protein